MVEVVAKIKQSTAITPTVLNRKPIKLCFVSNARCEQCLGGSYTCAPSQQRVVNNDNDALLHA